MSAPNPSRGEISAVINGGEMTLCLTLGALAELESVFDAGDLIDLRDRIAAGRVSAAHLVAVIGAGLRGGGNEISDEEVSRAQIDGGLEGCCVIAARLMQETFGDPTGQP